MQRKFCVSLASFAALSLSGDAAIVWNVGRDDNQWNLTGTGGGPSAVFVQETVPVNPLPGAPESMPINFSADNDYYFSGVYSTVIPSTTLFYGDYFPVGVVPANEEAAERAFSSTGNDLRYHFNLPNTLSPTDLLSVSFDAFNLDTTGGADPRYGVEVYFNGVLVMPQVIIRPAQINQDFTTPLFSQASVNAVTGPGADNIVSLVGTNYNGDNGGNWMGIDYVQLDSQPIPEPSSAAMILFAAMGAAPFLRRRA
jgi:hypothetical protein